MSVLQHALIGDWHHAVDAAIKAPALFLVAVLAYRFTERRVFTGLTAADWVAAGASGAIVGRTATATDASWLTGTAALVALLVTHTVVMRVRAGVAAGRVPDPRVHVLVRDGVPDGAVLRRCNLTGADLDAALRQAGHDGPASARLVILEAGGRVSVLPA